MEELKIRVKSFKNKKLASKLVPRQIYSPFRTSLGRTVTHIRSYSRNQQKSLIKARISPCRMVYIDKKTKPSLSISTETSNKSKVNEEDQNIIKTPTTVHEDHSNTEIDNVLQDYFNKNLFVHTVQNPPRARHRYNHTVDLIPMRSETPEIPTKKEEKLPVIPKKTKQARSPSPYEVRSKSRCKRRKSPLRCS